MTYAVEQALRLGTISFDAVRHLLLCHIERRPPRLDMENYPHLPLAHVHTTQASDYMTLLVEVAAEAVHEQRSFQHRDSKTNRQL